MREVVQRGVALAVAQALPPAPLALGIAENYDRAPDATKVQVATAAPADREVVKALVHSLAKECEDRAKTERSG